MVKTFRRFKVCDTYVLTYYLEISIIIKFVYGGNWLINTCDFLLTSVNYDIIFINYMIKCILSHNCKEGYCEKTCTSSILKIETRSKY